MEILSQCSNGRQMALLSQHYCISVEMVTGCVHWIVNVSNCKELWIARRKHQHLQTAGKYHKLGKRDGVQQKEKRVRGTERERKREGGCSVL